MGQAIMSNKEAAAYLGISIGTLATLRREGKVRYMQRAAGAKIQYWEPDLLAYLDSIARARTAAPRYVGETYRKRRK